MWNGNSQPVVVQKKTKQNFGLPTFYRHVFSKIFSQLKSLIYASAGERVRQFEDGESARATGTFTLSVKRAQKSSSSASLIYIIHRSSFGGTKMRFSKADRKQRASSSLLALDV